MALESPDRLDLEARVLGRQGRGGLAEERLADVEGHVAPQEAVGDHGVEAGVGFSEVPDPSSHRWWRRAPGDVAASRSVISLASGQVVLLQPGDLVEGSEPRWSCRPLRGQDLGRGGQPALHVARRALEVVGTEVDVHDEGIGGAGTGGSLSSGRSGQGGHGGRAGGMEGGGDDRPVGDLGPGGVVVAQGSRRRRCGCRRRAARSRRAGRGKRRPSVSTRLRRPPACASTAATVDERLPRVALGEVGQGRWKSTSLSAARGWPTPARRSAGGAGGATLSRKPVTAPLWAKSHGPRRTAGCRSPPRWGPGRWRRGHATIEVGATSPAEARERPVRPQGQGGAVDARLRTPARSASRRRSRRRSPCR